LHSLGHSKKGWTDGEIGREWIEDFDNKTKAKVNGRTKYLLVDGHNSHYTTGFLLYACQHNIEILCYPSHCTHIYQGLDVVIFSQLKKFWQEERDIEEREHRKRVSKTNFLSVYARAHIRALTPDNVKAAFRKTGVYPFNPSVITNDMLAPARETALEHHAVVPLETPVRVLVGAITKLQRQWRDAPSTSGNEIRATSPTTRSGNKTATSDNDDEGSSTDSDVPELLISAFNQLSKTQHPLFTNKPLGSRTAPPHFNTMMISPVKRHGDLLQVRPQSEHEKLLQAALHDAEVREAELKGEIRGQQAALVLQNVYCDKLRKEIFGQEEKRKKKPGNTALKIKDINKKGRLLTDPMLVELYAQHQTEIKEQNDEKQRKKVAREKHSEALKRWREGEEQRKKICAEVNEKYQAALESWIEEKELAKTEKRRTHWKKPVRGPLPKAAPKPKKQPEPLDEESGEEFDENDRNSSDNDTV
jgi:hypothetical protein